MRYFLIQTHPLYTNAPDVINWFSVFDKRNIKPDTSYKLPDRTLLKFRPHPDTVFCDIVSFPYLLISKMIKDLVLLYQPKTIFKEIILMDDQNDLAEVYYLPILPVIDCLHDTSEMNNDSSVIIRAVLDVNKIAGEKFFRIGGLMNEYYIVHVDLAEGMLRRGARGIGLTQVALYPTAEIYETKGRF